MKIVTQVLDCTYGKSAVGVRARLARASGGGWTTVAEAETNTDGCIEEWDSWHLERGLYRIVFDSDGYFAGLGGTAAYPEVVVIFRMHDESHAFQVQVTLAPYSYSTYFGTLESQPGDLWMGDGSKRYKQSLRDRSASPGSIRAPARTA